MKSTSIKHITKNIITEYITALFQSLPFVDGSNTFSAADVFILEIINITPSATLPNVTYSNGKIFSDENPCMRYTNIITDESSINPNTTAAILEIASIPFTAAYMHTATSTPITNPAFIPSGKTIFKKCSSAFNAYSPEPRKYTPYNTGIKYPVFPNFSTACIQTDFLLIFTGTKSNMLMGMHISNGKNNSHISPIPDTNTEYITERDILLINKSVYICPTVTIFFFVT